MFQFNLDFFQGCESWRTSWECETNKSQPTVLASTWDATCGVLTSCHVVGLRQWYDTGWSQEWELAGFRIWDSWFSSAFPDAVIKKRWALSHERGQYNSKDIQRLDAKSPNLRWTGKAARLESRLECWASSKQCSKMTKEFQVVVGLKHVKTRLQYDPKISQAPMFAVS